MGDEFDDSDLPDPSLKNILEQKSLQWVFVGGKGSSTCMVVSSLVESCVRVASLTHTH